MIQELFFQLLGFLGSGTGGQFGEEETDVSEHVPNVIWVVDDQNEEVGWDTDAH